MPSVNSSFLPSLAITISIKEKLDTTDTSPENCFKVFETALEPMKEHWIEQGYQDLRIGNADSEKHTLDPHSEAVLELKTPEGNWVQAGTINPCHDEKDELKSIQELAPEMLAAILEYTLNVAFNSQKQARAETLLNDFTQEDAGWRQRCAAFQDAMDALDDPLDLGLFRSALSSTYSLSLAQMLDEAAEKGSLGNDLDASEYRAVCEVVFGTVLPELFDVDLENPLSLLVTMALAEKLWEPIVEFLEKQGKELFPEQFEDEVKVRIASFREELETTKEEMNKTFKALTGE